MRGKLRQTWLKVATLCLLVGGLATPIIVAGQSNQRAPGPSQLTALVSAAEESGVYARAVVDYAASHGLSTSTYSSLLSQGDAQLASAKADSQSGSDASAGIQAAQAAMSDYTSAAASASVAISGAGLMASVDYSAVEQSIAEVNATAAAVATVGASACAQAGGSAAGATALAQACSEFDAAIAGARANLTEAAAVAAQSDGQVNASLGFSQALALVAAARAGVNSTQPVLLTIASYGYVQRADAYVSAFIDPLAAQASSTITAEKSVNSSFARFQQNYLAYSQSQASSVGVVTSSASALAAAVSAVNTADIVAGASTADGVASQVDSNLSALLALPGFSALAGAAVVSDVSACQSATTSFTQQVNAVNTESAAYSQAGISAFPAYVATMNRYASNLQSTGTAYTAAYAKVLSDLSPLLGSNLAGLSTIYADLLGLQVSGSVSGVEGSLGQATSAMATVQADIDAYANAVATQDSLIVMQPELLGSAASVASSAQAYLDAAGASAMANASVSVQAVSHAAQLFVASANSSTSLEVGFFGSAEQSLASSGTALVAQTSACARAVATAGTYVDADIDSRVADSVTAQGDVASALQLFSSLDIGGGVSAMAQASLEFQAASAAGAP